MPASSSLLILGASTRAAAFSALRSGFQPVCGDLFADADLAARCPAFPVSPSRYPEGLAEVARGHPGCPWMFTGALENRPELVDRITKGHELLGNAGDVLRRVRDPFQVADCLKQAGLFFPEVRSTPAGLPCDGSWLAKPVRSGGGSGIHPWDGLARATDSPVYYQQRLSGMACAAIYVGNGKDCLLLGVTEQLVGQAFTHARTFTYCGSLGPLRLGSGIREHFERLGQALVACFGLRGLWGVDAILRDGHPWPVEVNPRYTASVEILEYATGVKSIRLHCDGSRGLALASAPPAPDIVFGKAILFATRPVAFERELSDLAPSGPMNAMPDYADIPRAGTSLHKGQPILTVFGRAADREQCLQTLRKKCEEMDSMLKA